MKNTRNAHGLKVYNPGPRLLTAYERLNDADTALKDALSIIEGWDALGSRARSVGQRLSNSICNERLVANAIHDYLDGLPFDLESPSYCKKGVEVEG